MRGCATDVQHPLSTSPPYEILGLDVRLGHAHTFLPSTLPGDTTAETPGSCGIFVIGPLVLLAGAENYAKPLRRLNSPINLAVCSLLALSCSQPYRAPQLKLKVKEL